MYAADEVYDTGFLEEYLPDLDETCDYVVDGEQLEGGWVYTRCGKPAVQVDEDGALCAEHAA
jgi:hypothetical protein